MVYQILIPQFKKSLPSK